MLNRKKYSKIEKIAALPYKIHSRKKGISMKRKWIAAVLMSMLFCLSLSGCAGDGKEETAAKAAPDFEPLNETIEGRKNIYLIVKNLESSYWEVMIDGARDGGDAFDCNVFYSGTYVETDWKGQEKLLDMAADAGADAILLAPDDSIELSEQIHKIYDKGIHVVLLDTIANTNSYDICYMTDNLMAGEQAAREMIAQLRKNGTADSDEIQIGLQLGSASSQTISERLAGFFKYWSQNAPASWEIIPDIKCNDGYLDKAVECAEELLEYPNIKGMFGTNNSSTKGFAQVVKEHERKDIVVIGFDYSDEIAELINDEDYAASTLLQKQYYMSYTGIETSLKLLKGETIPVKFADMGVIVVNNETIGNAEVQEVLRHN